RLKTWNGLQTYYSQSNEWLNSTVNMSRREQLGTCVDEVRAGNRTIPGKAYGIATWLYWRIRRRILGEYARGRSTTSTPVAGLNAKSGDRGGGKTRARDGATVTRA